MKLIITNYSYEIAWLLSIIKELMMGRNNGERFVLYMSISFF